MKTQINILQLVYPPISNQEAEWVKDDPEVQEMIGQSNLYMICHRQEAFFINIDHHACEASDGKILPFEIKCGETTGSGYVDVQALIENNHVDVNKCDIKIEIGSKLYRLWITDSDTGENLEILEWFTIEKLLLDRSHNHYAVFGLDNYVDFMTYHLHYVGISKVDDSLTRLVVKPHDKRLRILSNEQPIREGARVTDELFLLFFTVNPLRISIVETDDDIDEIVSFVGFDNNQIIADAEKAYVNILKSRYNEIKFKGYPKGADGLYDSGLARYAYVLGEDLVLSTLAASIRGGHIKEWSWPSGMDCIFIEKDTVTLMKYDDNDTA